LATNVVGRHFPAKRNGLAMAADIIERAFGVNTKSNG
jgi:hypothetical protein